MGQHTHTPAALGRAAKAALLALGCIVAVTVVAITLISAPTSSAETPAERCKRETTAYNTAWKQAWVLAHPGSTVDDAPTPNPPYKCGQNNETTPTITTPSTTEEAPTTTEASTETSSSSPASGPNLNPPTSTSSPAANITSGQAPIRSGQRDGTKASLCSDAAGHILKSVSLSNAYMLCQNGGVVSVYEENGNRSFVGNIFSGSFQETTGKTAADVTRLTNGYRESASSRSEVDTNPDPCNPNGNPSKEILLVDPWHARANADICYGKIENTTLLRTRVVWSEWLRYQMNQELTNRSNQVVRWTNLISTDQPDVRLGWNLREDVPGEDPFFGPEEYENIPYWRNSQESRAQYGVPYEEEIYLHLTNDRTYISGGRHYFPERESNINIRMPTFYCSPGTRRNPTPCNFPGAPTS
ncbi:hypothetical protein ABLE94_05860 [Gordonia sp. VNK1]|uniref:hypothetical protein n=1 Tax=Gordonia oleivorans TaxID=3156618 RepID=UPI0032B57833